MSYKVSRRLKDRDKEDMKGNGIEIQRKGDKNNKDEEL